MPKLINLGEVEVNFDGFSVTLASGAFVGSDIIVFVFARLGNLNFLRCEEVVDAGGLVVGCLKVERLVAVGGIVSSIVVCLIGKRLALDSAVTLARTFPRNLLRGSTVVGASVVTVLDGNLCLGKVAC